MQCAGPRAVRYADLGGIEKVLQDICQLIHQPLQHPEVSVLKSHIPRPIIQAISTVCLHLHSFLE